jgi:glyoxylase-like metal-dependent hydrolase (beta-lactamase superfamily II)
MSEPSRIVTDSMAGMRLPDAAVWSPLVTVVLGQNPSMFTGPGTNTYLVGSGKRPLLLDTGQGVDAYFPVLEHARREVRPTESFDAIVLTHAHIDHVGGIPRLLVEHGDGPVIKMPWPGHDSAEVSFTWIGDGDTVETEGATLRAIWTPGHARDHLCYYLEEEKALFTGDVVLGAGTTVIPDDGDLGDYLASLRRLRELEIDVIYPAHGPAIHKPHQKIDEYLAHRELRERQILAGLREGPASARSLVERIYVDIPTVLHPAAEMSVRAHLRKLQKDEIVAQEGDSWHLR